MGPISGLKGLRLKRVVVPVGNFQNRMAGELPNGALGTHNDTTDKMSSKHVWFTQGKSQAYIQLKQKEVNHLKLSKQELKSYDAFQQCLQVKMFSKGTVSAD